MATDRIDPRSETLTPDELSARQRLAETVARDAGRLALALRANPRGLEITLKGPQDVVTAADGEVERSIVAALVAAFPGDTLLGEEGGGNAGDRCWVIDPIDGTANFARGLPHWCVAIAFVAAGRTEVGVIYDPNDDLLYSARRRMGARLNAVPIRVSATDDPAHASVDIGYSRRTGIDDFARIMRRLLKRGINVTQGGSEALGLARVADGRLDGYAERHLYAWDALAGLLLVEEAGGRVNAFLNGGGLTSGNETMAATPGLYAVIASALEVR
jgi:myo-inositol-1(or 4)-monophosphatase